MKTRNEQPIWNQHWIKGEGRWVSQFLSLILGCDIFWLLCHVLKLSPLVSDHCDFIFFTNLWLCFITFSYFDTSFHNIDILYTSFHFLSLLSTNLGLFFTNFSLFLTFAKYFVSFFLVSHFLTLVYDIFWVVCYSLYKFLTSRDFFYKFVAYFHKKMASFFTSLRYFWQVSHIFSKFVCWQIACNIFSPVCEFFDFFL